MNTSATKKFDLAIAVSLVPILGTGVVLMDQLGRFLYYGVPAELLELDAYKILISSLSTIFVGSALLYAATTLYDPAGKKPAVRFVFHLAFAAAITAVFWAPGIHWGAPVSVPTVAFVTFTGFVLFMTERWWRRHRSMDDRERLGELSLVVALVSILVFLATLTHGYLGERDRTIFTFVAGTDDAVVGRSGDLLILKPYDRERGRFIATVTKLQSVESLTLEQRNLSRATP